MQLASHGTNVILVEESFFRDELLHKLASKPSYRTTLSPQSAYMIIDSIPSDTVYAQRDTNGFILTWLEYGVQKFCQFKEYRGSVTQQIVNLVKYDTSFQESQDPAIIRQHLANAGINEHEYANIVNNVFQLVKASYDAMSMSTFMKLASADFTLVQDLRTFTQSLPVATYAQRESAIRAWFRAHAYGFPPLEEHVQQLMEKYSAYMTLGRAVS